MQTLRPEIKERILESIEVKAQLCIELAKHMSTIERMVRGDSLLLTTAAAVRVISKELGIPESQVLTKAVARQH